MSKLVVVVPRSRAYCGRAVLLDAGGGHRFGPFRAMATASRRVARKHGNPTCDPLRPFGHPPAGTYAVASSLPPTYVHPRRPGRFGAVGALLLAPRSGDALASLANGRRVFAIHGGRPDVRKRLRPTRGGVRLSDADMLGLLRAMNAAQRQGDPLTEIEIVEVPDADIRSVPTSDLRGARRTLGSSTRGKAAPFLALLVTGAAATLGTRKVRRRDVLRLALVAVGGLAANACSKPSPCTPLACDPGERFFTDGGPKDGGAHDGGKHTHADAGTLDGGDADAGDAALDGGVPAEDGGASPGAASTTPCPPEGYVCAEDDPGYVAGGGVG